MKKYPIEAILKRATELHIILLAIDGHIHAEGPAEAMTDKLRGVIAAHKVELLAVLPAAPPDVLAAMQETTLCFTCLNENQEEPGPYEGPNEIMYCQKHLPDPKHSLSDFASHLAHEVTNRNGTDAGWKIHGLHRASESEAMKQQHLRYLAASLADAHHEPDRDAVLTEDEQEVIQRIAPGSHGLYVSRHRCRCGCRIRHTTISGNVCAVCEPGALWSDLALHLLRGRQAPLEKTESELERQRREAEAARQQERNARHQALLTDLANVERTYDGPFMALCVVDGVLAQTGMHGASPGEFWTMEEWEALPVKPAAVEIIPQVFPPLSPEEELANLKREFLAYAMQFNRLFWNRDMPGGYPNYFIPRDEYLDRLKDCLESNEPFQSEAAIRDMRMLLYGKDEQS